MILTNAKIVLEDKVINGSLEIEGNRIASVSEENRPGLDLGGAFLCPGFVDEHCHGSGEYWFFEEPKKAAEYHLKSGTTSLLCSMWRNAGKYSYEKAILNVKSAMGEGSNIRGVHMEGPYVDADLGSEGGEEHPCRREEYEHLIEISDGIIKQWTFDPLQKGAEDFARCAAENGIVLSVCYSKARPEELLPYMDLGLSVAGHMLCASGSAKPQFVGTKEPGSDVFTLVEDRMYAEVIADSMGAHVRPYYLKLIYKCKGADKIALVSDCCAGGDTHDSDINVINGELYGSRLTLSVAIKNMKKHTNAPITDLVKMASATPARAMGLYGERGSIEAGKIADLAVLNENLDVMKVFLAGKEVR